MAFLRGDNNDNVINGTAVADTILGRRGDDSLIGLAGNDYIRGDDGNDTVEGGDGEDQLFGNDGDDQILGGDGNDLLNGGDGEDGMDGGDGDDTLLGGDNTSIRTTRDIEFRDPDTLELIFSATVPTSEFIGGDTLVGGAGNDLILGNGGDDIADGGADSDTIVGGTGDDLIFGGTGDDDILGGTDNDTLVGESGNDTLIGSGGEDLIIGDQDAFGGADGNDDINAGAGDDIVFGGGGSDTILGGDGNDLIDGGDSRGGDTTLAVRDNNGNDEILGGIGNDTIRGGLGRDTLNGGGTRAGEIDFLRGGGVIDGVGTFADSDSDLFILGNEDAFLYRAGAGDVIGTNIFGQSDRAIIQDFQNGLDKIQVNDPAAIITDTLGTTSTFILIAVANGFEIIGELQGFTGTLAADTFVTPVDNSGDDVFQGTDEVNDVINGGEGNDELSGLGGDDTLDGGAGNDMLFGGAGNDSLIGGTGADTLTGATGTGVGELDRLVGEADGEVDRFVLGDSNSAFYIGGGANFGLADRAIIENFENGVDEIQVNTSGGVIVNALGSATDTFILTQVNGNFEIIAQIVGVTAAEFDTSTLIAA